MSSRFLAAVACLSIAACGNPQKVDPSQQVGPNFSVRRFMDEFNALGMIPVSMIRWEMTGQREP